MKYLTETLNVCESVVKIQGMDWPVLMSPNTLAQLTIAATLQDHVESKVCLYTNSHVVLKSLQNNRSTSSG